MNFPFAEKIGFSRNPLDYILVGNKLFPLKLWLLRPYSGYLTDFQKVFNSWYIGISLENIPSSN